jgi:hypothetical protein
MNLVKNIHSKINKITKTKINKNKKIIFLYKIKIHKK